MRNIKLTLEYDGIRYSGWQSQKNGLGVQDVVCKAVEKMTEEKINLIGASRTDAGVHALGQVASFQTEKGIPCEGFLRGINSLLPDDIRVVVCEEAGLAFHPIREARGKEYEYLLEVAKIPSALLRHRVWWVGSKINCVAMEDASRCLIGEHDFKSFQGALSEAKTTVRNIYAIDFVAEEESVRIRFFGNGFLKYMIRNIVGTFVDIGRGRPLSDMARILYAKDRTQAGPTAPPHGLYLVRVEY